MVTEEQVVEKTLPCVRIGVADARKLRAKVQGMKRAAMNIEYQARLIGNDADGFLRLLDLLIEPLSTETNEP